MDLRFILRSKGYEDERFVFDNTVLTTTTAPIGTQKEKDNILFNYAIRGALIRKNVDSFILYEGVKVIASVRRNMLYWHDDKPKHLFVIGRLLK